MARNCGTSTYPHDTTKQKPAERLVEERKALQTLPPRLLPVASTLPKHNSLPSLSVLSQQPLHHDLSIYDQLMEAI